MNIYLDIDGVLLDYGENPAPHAEELIEYLVNNHEVYWLTTHCKGDALHTQIHLAQFFEDLKTLKNISKIKPTNWNNWKTEAINFDEPFVWIDDDLYLAEERELEKHNSLKNFMLVSLREEPNDLAEIIKLLKEDSPRSDAKANMPW